MRVCDLERQGYQLSILVSVSVRSEDSDWGYFEIVVKSSISVSGLSAVVFAFTYAGENTDLNVRGAQIICVSG